MREGNKMLEIKQLNKSYGKNRVLMNLDLQIEENKIYGLLGRNGVGKTTLLNILASQIVKDSGEIKLDQQDIFENNKAMEEICFVKDRGIAMDDEKVKKLFEVAAALYKNWDEEYKDKLVKEFKLDVRKKYKKLSRGYQTMVGLIIGMASRSRITIFDEPSLGLDAAYRYKFYNMLLEDYDRYPRTIIISTHLIDEVSNLFEEIIILDEGKIMLQETTDSLMKKAWFLSGREENLKGILKNKTVISKETFGATDIVGIFNEITEEENKKIRKLGIEIAHIPLQKLFVYLTENINSREVI